VDSDQDWRTCLHEAGHAVAALMLGIGGIGAVVFDEGGGVATPTPESARPADLTAYTDENVSAAYAGSDVAETLRDGVFTAAGTACVDLVAKHPLFLTRVTSRGDSLMLAAGCRRVCRESDHDDDVEFAFERLALARARALLRPVLGRVVAVARELQQKRRLTSGEVAAAMWPELEL
jgi:hypothetical protein